MNEYDAVADEYYDASKHPTCANFREASLHAISVWLPQVFSDHCWTLEVGAGMSAAAELLHEQRMSPKHLIISDPSRSMLGYSRAWSSQGADLIAADATMIPIHRESIGLAISCLGDPYNCDSLWKELQRVLQPGGFVIYTTPAHGWMSAFRDAGDPEHLTKAEFELGNGARVFVPSIVLPVQDQVALAKRFGLSIVDVAQMGTSVLKKTAPSKKLVVSRGPSAPIVTAYLFRKSR